MSPPLPIQAQMHVCEQNRWLLSLYVVKWFVSYAATPKEASGGGVGGRGGGTGSLDNQGAGLLSAYLVAGVEISLAAFQTSMASWLGANCLDHSHRA